MIKTTTPSIEGYVIEEYRGIVSGEVIAGINFIKDFKASLTNVFGGRSTSYEDELIMARTKAISEMEKRASQLGANAIVGIDLDFETLGNGGSNMLIAVATGTAVVAVKK